MSINNYCELVAAVLNTNNMINSQDINAIKKKIYKKYSINVMPLKDMINFFFFFVNNNKLNAKYSIYLVDILSLIWI